MRSTPVNINDPAIAVVLNAWADLDQPSHQQCFDTTLRVIDSMPSITTVLLAGTHVTLDQETQGPNCWFDNSKKIFVDEQGVDWVRRYWSVARDPGFTTHNSKIRDHNYQGKLCLGIWEQWELEYLLNHYLLQEKNIWFFGSGLGVRRDPMGWGSLCDLIKHKHVRPMHILTHQHGIAFNTQSDSWYKKSKFTWVNWDQTDWQDIGNNIRLKTTLEWQIPPWE
jgi:hypothetical protein